LIAALKKVFPNIEGVINPTKPRRNSFEITLVTDSGERSLLWSGLKKGPPRREKFPEHKIVIDLLKKSRELM